MHEEVELKLALEPEQLARLRRHPLIRSLAQGPARKRLLSSTYFDTPTLNLQQRGMALRVRRLGARRVQTLKALADGNGGLQHFREIETPVFDDRPDLAILPQSSLGALVGDASLLQALEPVFTTEVERRMKPLRFADTAIELAFDEGKIVAGPRECPLCEAELELVTGEPARLYELALALRESIEFRLEHRTKAARGYQLVTGAGAEARKAAVIELEPSMSATTAFTVLARGALDQITANEEAALEGTDPEGVHQLRVGVRRLRSLASIFAPVMASGVRSELKGELTWLHQCFGPARDWDVFLTETLDALAPRLSNLSGLKTLRREAEALKSEAYRLAQETLFTANLTMCSTSGSGKTP